MVLLKTDEFINLVNFMNIFDLLNLCMTNKYYQSLFKNNKELIFKILLSKLIKTDNYNPDEYSKIFKSLITFSFNVNHIIKDNSYESLNESQIYEVLEIAVLYDQNFLVNHLENDDRLFISYELFIEKYSILYYLDKNDEDYLDQVLDYKEKDIDESYHLSNIAKFRDYLFCYYESDYEYYYIDNIALISAIKHNHFDIVKYFVESGLNISAYVNRALITSVKVQNLEMTKYFIENGADIHCRWNGVIRFAKDPKLIRYLHNNGIYHRRNGYAEYDDYSEGFQSDRSDEMYFSDEYYSDQNYDSDEEM